MRIQAAVKDVFREMGGCIGCGGFMVDENGRLVEEYTEDEEEASEGMIEDGDEPQDSEGFCGADCIRGTAECSGS